jgi:hypothetical protein
VKTFAVLLALSALAVPASVLLAQEQYGTIRVTVKRLPDGGQMTTKTDPEKHTTEEVTTDAGNKVLKKTTYLLDEGNLPTEAIFCDAKGNILYKTAYQRDTWGHVTEARFLAADDTYLGKRVFVYGANGQPTQVTDYDANGQMVTPAGGGKPKKNH